MPRVADPNCARRVATGVSEEERIALERIAQRERVQLAAVVRWAVLEYLDRHSDQARDSLRVVATP